VSDAFRKRLMAALSFTHNRNRSFQKGDSVLALTVVARINLAGKGPPCCSLGDLAGDVPAELPPLSFWPALDTLNC